MAEHSPDSSAQGNFWHSFFSDHRCICVSASDIYIDDLHWKNRRYNSFMAYSESKLANVLFSAELARRLEGNFIVKTNFMMVDILD
jgi:NAD(P)-dependent dehydrogenase (short-subunit alcohol dehydrogenase family)